MNRPGDMSNEERVNEGQCELSHFFPNDNGGSLDAYSAIVRSPRRQWIYFDKVTRKTHQSTSRESQFIKGVKLPDYVITSPIEIDGKKWKYETPVEPSPNMRRVFIERNQVIELDLEETLRWLNISDSSGIEEAPRMEDIIGATEKERNLAFLKAQNSYNERKKGQESTQARYALTLGQLEKEASIDNINNQVILQLMYERVENGESLLSYGASLKPTEEGD